MVTIYDIAKQAGVSTNTVSRVLNGATYERPTYRRRAERIREIARELGYRPNLSARATSNGRFNAVTLLLSADSNESHTPSPLLYGVHAGAYQHGMTVNMAVVADKQLEDESFIPRVLSEWHSDGILISYTKSPPQRLIELLDKYKVPAIWLNYNGNSDCVLPNDWDAGRKAADEMLRLGHRRIAFVRMGQAEFHPHYSEVARRDGYIARMREAGLKPICIDSDNRFEKSSEPRLDAWVELMSQADAPTAFVAYGLEEANLVIAAGVGAGKKVAVDFSLIVFHPTQSSLGMAIPMHTLGVPFYEMGIEGINVLVNKIGKETKSHANKLIDYQLIQGHSVSKLNQDSDG